MPSGSVTTLFVRSLSTFADGVGMNREDGHDIYDLIAWYIEHCQETVTMNKRHVLVFVADAYEDLELWYPKLRLVEAGVGVTVAGPEAGATYHGKHGYPCVSDAAIDQMDVENFDGLILPGGWMPDKLRRDPNVLALVRGFDQAGKLIAAICHGGWIAISAGVYRGVRVTGSPGIKDDLVNAGALWCDEPLVVDRHFASSRRPDDLPAFCGGVLEVLAVARPPDREGIR